MARAIMEFISPGFQRPDPTVLGRFGVSASVASYLALPGKG